jgi:hypothetical protein
MLHKPRRIRCEDCNQLVEPDAVKYDDYEVTWCKTCHNTGDVCRRDPLNKENWLYDGPPCPDCVETGGEIFKCTSPLCDDCYDARSEDYGP